MCGIAGVTGRIQKENAVQTVKKMTDCMSHRGPDSDGFFAQDGIALGHRRLSIIDLSEAANQPMLDETGRYVIIFNGELYNFRDVKPTLTEYRFSTVSDTEVVLASYIKWGADCLHRLKGMFAFVIWDKEKKELFIARDRFGVKPLYYYLDDEVLLFGSEIRSLLATGKIERKLNSQAIGDYLKYQSAITPLTLVSNIMQLPAGHFLRYTNGVIEISCYWDITQRHFTIPETDLKDIHKRIRELLFRSVEQRLISDVPLGAFLSGGIDSSAVVGIMAEVSNARPNAFTVSFEEKEYDESYYANLVAKKFNVHHTTVLLKAKDFLDQLPHALDAMDTPSGDGLNTYVVSKAIRKSGITVALSGIGGDELFAGYPIFNRFLKLKKNRGLFNATRRLRNMASHLIPASGQRQARLKEMLQAPVAEIEYIYPIFRRIQPKSQIEQITNIRNGQLSGPMEENLLSHKEALHHFQALSQVSIADYMAYTQHVLLKDTDQMAMASSLEVREPFFDHELVEYVLNIPDAIKFPTYPKSLLVESLKPMLPDEIVFRKKQGFVLPYDVWIRNDLKAFCTEKIKNLADRSFINADVLLDYWQNYLAGKQKIRWTDIWILIVLEHWLERNNVN
jgi:asparagine synthase (glutamine-hydrolysing)